jgi:hypothetical protein
MFGGVDFFGYCGSVDLGIPESLFSKRRSSFNFRPIQKQDYVTSIKYHFWCYKPYKVQITISVRKINFPLSIVFSIMKELINNKVQILEAVYVTVT